jgi:addiction module HigA family antidote
MSIEQTPPIHPGKVLQKEFMLPMSLSSNALAKHLWVTPARINEIVNQKRGITADTALRLARYFRTTPVFWMNLQQHYELETARHLHGDKILNEIIPVSN